MYSVGQKTGTTSWNNNRFS